MNIRRTIEAFERLASWHDLQSWRLRSPAERAAAARAAGGEGGGGEDSGEQREMQAGDGYATSRIPNS